MAHVRRLLAVEADIEQVFTYTLQRFGLRKYDDYAALIQEALDALAVDPPAGKPQPAIAPEAWTIHIAQRGRRARHLFMYRVPEPDVVEVLALAYDGMDLCRANVASSADWVNPMTRIRSLHRHANAARDSTCQLIIAKGILRDCSNLRGIHGQRQARVHGAFAVEDKTSRDFLVGQSKHDKTPFDFIDMSAQEPWDSKVEDELPRTN